jgi:hypothetical protein
MSKLVIRTSVLSAAIALAFAGSAFAAPKPHAAKSVKTVASVAANPQPAGGSVILLDQTSSPGTNGVLAMRNLDAGSEPYDSEIADDFSVPTGGWAVSQVRIGTFYQNGPTPVTPSTAGNVTFYTNVAGAPGSAVAGCTFTSIPLSYDSATGYSTLNLPTECALAEGSYWMAFSGDLSYNAEEGGVYVAQQTVTTGAPPVWRNPGDGFGSGCANWSPLLSCQFDSNGGMVFQLLGRTTPVSLQSYGID